MQNTKLVNSLKQLNPKEIAKFEKFINSPFFAERSQLPVIFSHLKKYADEYNISRSELFAEAFKDKPFNDQLMRKYISELNRMLDKFLTVNSFLDDHWAFTARLAEVKIRSNRIGELKKLTSAALSELKKPRVINEDHFNNICIFESYQDMVEDAGSGVLTGSFGLKAINSFADYSAIRVLKFYSKLLNNRKYIRGETGYKLLDDLVKLYHESGRINNPLARIYYNILQLQLDADDIDHYFSLKELLFKNEKILDKDELRGFFIFMHNYCYEKADTGNLDFVKERYDIMKQFLLKGYCFVDGVMKGEFFSSMILSALMLGKLGQAEEFYTNYKETIPSSNRSSLLNFTMANILLYKKEYNRAIDLLGKIEYNDHFDNIRTRTLYIMIYFELNMFDVLKYQADTFRRYLNNNSSITSYIRNRGNNFLKQTLQIVKYRKKLVKEILIPGFDSKAVMNRPWLLKKIEEAKNH